MADTERRDGAKWILFLFSFLFFFFFFLLGEDEIDDTGRLEDFLKCEMERNYYYYYYCT